MDYVKLQIIAAKCQKKHWPNRRNLCQSIAALEEQRQERIDQSCLFNSSLSQHGREKVVGLVGEKCLVKCIANKNATVMLLDTGAQVSIVSKSYLTKNSPELTVKGILENGDSFRVQWGNSTPIPFLGWTSLNVQVGDETNSATLDVPYLVTSGEIEYPILGFNAIREIVRINNDTQMLKKIFENVFNSTDHQKIDSLVNFIAATEEEAQTSKNKRERHSSTSREGITRAVQGRCGVFGEENIHDVSTA